MHPKLRLPISAFSSQDSKLLPRFYMGASKSLGIKPEQRVAGASLTLYLFLNTLLCTKSSNLVLLPALFKRSTQGGCEEGTDVSPGTVAKGFLRPVPGITLDTSSGRDLAAGPAQSIVVHLHNTPWLQEGFTDVLKGSGEGRATNLPRAQPAGRGHLLQILRQLGLASLFTQGVSGG